MTHLPFTKMQAIGNDFVLLDESDLPSDAAWSTLAPRLCDRKFGVGADGLIVVAHSDGVGPVRMHYFNADGSADMCGNGLRCVAEYAFQRGCLGADSEGTFTLHSPAGEHQARRTEGPNGGVTWLITMGAPKLAPWEVPVIVDGDAAVDFPLMVGDRRFTATALSTGSAHVVLFLDGPIDDATFVLSPQIENHPIFPERTNVMWAWPAPDAPARDAFQVRIWERGVGETLGCGTGACAVGIAARLTGRTEAEFVLVGSPGGTLGVRWSPEGEGGGTMLLAGPAQIVYTGEIP